MTTGTRTCNLLLIVCNYNQDSELNVQSQNMQHVNVECEYVSLRCSIVMIHFLLQDAFGSLGL